MHAQVGALAKTQGVATLITCGRLSRAASTAFGEGARHFDDRDAVIAYMTQNLDGQERVLVKGSRSSQMDIIVNALIQNYGLKEASHAA
jgi:UDP-N-acetylmuramoyl-tripeptide--D-alanyl-D-alanine ligase